ncbi:UbiA family prenyltransferase [Paremcibacter congregatus]|uniref:UbiA family prenyltransferase n=1 Tax=Paremcibacter congregatus TaxID=2043170 RepID=UPI0030ED7C96
MDRTIINIFVDLDGTLIKTDLLFESALKFIKINPLHIFYLIVWLIQGKATLKHNLAQKIKIDVTVLLYQKPLLDYLKIKNEQGCRLILATASHIHYARSVADHLNIFDDVIATDIHNNMKGHRKLTAIQDYVKGDIFSYAGDSNADIPIWREATSNIFVNAPVSVIKEAHAAGKAEKIIETRERSTSRAFIKEMRLHQWAKNVLVFIPLLTSHAYMNADALLMGMLAFICFSFCASGVYFLNDLLDIEADRKHKTKKYRPIASGDLSIPYGVIGALILPVFAFTLAGLFLPFNFVIVLAVYFLITNGYSFYLKRISTADIMTLAVLYTTRVVAGAVATGITLSSWLLVFSIFVFVSLAYLKRYIEVSVFENDNKKVEGRGYSAADSETMFSLGISNITASVLVLAFYINSDEVRQMYKTPEILWGLCLLMLYWGNRIWVGARRGKISDDPVVFAIKDKVSRMVGLGFILVVVAAKFIVI